MIPSTPEFPESVEDVPACDNLNNLLGDLEQSLVSIQNVTTQNRSTESTSEISGDPNESDVIQTRDVVQEQRIAKIQKTKSQELRDFTQEFVLSTTLDFDPMSFQDHTPTLLRNTAPRSSKRTVQSEEEKNVAEPTPPPKLEPEITKDLDVSRKQEILPSDSFLTSLNKEAGSGSSEESTPSDALLDAESRVNEMFPAGPPLVSSETSPVPLNILATSTPKPTAEKRNGDTLRRQQQQQPVGASSDLLEWSKSILVKYSSVKVTNFTTSWRNGLAFCAVIHSFYPDLISFQDLNSHDIKHNCRLAFEAGEMLGIPRVLEPEAMVIKKIPDKLAVITYLHQLRSSLGTAETNQIYETSKLDKDVPTLGIRKSFSEGNIKLFSKTGSIDKDRPPTELATVQEEGGTGDSLPASKYRQKAKDFMAAARRDSLDKSESLSPERENTSPNVIMRQKSLTPKPKRDNRLSYIDNEMMFLDAEQQEIDRQAAILDKRIRETSDDDQLVYDALLQQWFTLVNKKNTLLRRQMQLNILEKEDDLEKKFMLLQDELRTYSEMDDRRKTEEDHQREELLLQELVLVVNQRNELVLQRDAEERMIENDQQIEQDVTLPEDRLVHNKAAKDECKMQ